MPLWHAIAPQSPTHEADEHVTDGHSTLDLRCLSHIDPRQALRERGKTGRDFQEEGDSPAAASCLYKFVTKVGLNPAWQGWQRMHFGPRLCLTVWHCTGTPAVIQAVLELMKLWCSFAPVHAVCGDTQK